MAVLLEKEEYLAAQCLSPSASTIVQLPRQQVHWKAPVRGWVKVNWDATTSEISQTMGIRFMIRDCQGDVLACLSSSKSFHSLSIVAEYSALWKAMTFCMDLGFDKV